jgi:small subunit ribosomal protein S19
MARSYWKAPFVEAYVIKKVEQALKENKKDAAIRVWSRRSTILPEWVGLVFEVHNGKRFDTVRVSEDMVGHKLGEFSVTRKQNIWEDKKGRKSPKKR